MSFQITSLHYQCWSTDLLKTITGYVGTTRQVFITHDLIERQWDLKTNLQRATKELVWCRVRGQIQRWFGRIVGGNIGSVIENIIYPPLDKLLNEHPDQFEYIVVGCIVADYIGEVARGLHRDIGKEPISIFKSIAEDLSNGDILIDGTPINKLNERLVNLDGTI